MNRRVASELEWLECQRCPLCKTRTNTVIGYGNPNAKIVFIGEGPGATEDIKGRPFVGKAGGVFNEFLYQLGVDYEEIFVDNVVACRPFVIENDKKVDRHPNPEEVRACLPRVHRMIYDIDPVLIVLMGNTAFHSLVDHKALITKARGGVYDVVVPGVELPVTYSAVATFHPSFLARNPRGKRSGKPNSIWGNFAHDIALAVKMHDAAVKLYYDQNIKRGK